MSLAKIRIYWRDSRHPEGVLREERTAEVPRKHQVPPEFIPGNISSVTRSAADRERLLRNFVRHLPPAQRKFVLTLRKVCMDEKGPENLQRKKIMKALKIKSRTYVFHLRDIARKHLPAAISGGR